MCNSQTEHESLTESQKILVAHSCKSWVTNLLIIPHTLGILTANTTYCIALLKYINESQVNACVVWLLLLQPKAAQFDAT